MQRRGLTTIELGKSSDTQKQRSASDTEEQRSASDTEERIWGSSCSWEQGRGFYSEDRRRLSFKTRRTWDSCENLRERRVNKVRRDSTTKWRQTTEIISNCPSIHAQIDSPSLSWATQGRTRQPGRAQYIALQAEQQRVKLAKTYQQSIIEERTGLELGGRRPPLSVLLQTWIKQARNHLPSSLQNLRLCHRTLQLP